jgi:hypothetical protein
MESNNMKKSDPSRGEPPVARSPSLDFFAHKKGGISLPILNIVFSKKYKKWD